MNFQIFEGFTMIDTYLAGFFATVAIFILLNIAGYFIKKARLLSIEKKEAEEVRSIERTRILMRNMTKEDI